MRNTPWTALSVSVSGRAKDSRRIFASSSAVAAVAVAEWWREARKGQAKPKTELEVVERILPLAHSLSLSSGYLGAFVRDL